MNCLRTPKLLLLLLALCSTFFVQAQERTITGKVTDQQTGKPLEGVSVKIKNTTQGTVTNAEGQFSLKAPSTESVISISYVGYLVYETKVGTTPVFTIQLASVDRTLDDVVVVGYGTKKRVNVQGSVATLKAADIEDIPV